MLLTHKHAFKAYKNVFRSSFRSNFTEPTLKKEDIKLILNHCKFNETFDYIDKTIQNNGKILKINSDLHLWAD